MAINVYVVSVHHNGGFLAGLTLLIQCYYHHRGTRLNPMKRFCIYLQPIIPPKRFFYISPPDWEMLKMSRCVQIFLSIVHVCLKKNQNAPRPSEHPPVMGGKCQNVYVGSKAANTKKTLHGI